MNSSTLVTSLLGHRVRLHRPPEGSRATTGRITTVYIDNDGMHYVILVEGRLVHCETGSEFTVLEDDDD